MEMQKIQDFNSEIEQFLPQKANFFSFFPHKEFFVWEFLVSSQGNLGIVSNNQ